MTSDAFHLTKDHNLIRRHTDIHTIIQHSINHIHTNIQSTAHIYTHTFNQAHTCKYTQTLYNKTVHFKYIKLQFNLGKTLFVMFTYNSKEKKIIKPFNLKLCLEIKKYIKLFITLKSHLGKYSAKVNETVYQTEIMFRSREVYRSVYHTEIMCSYKIKLF